MSALNINVKMDEQIDKPFLEKLIKKPKKISSLNFEQISPILSLAKKLFQEESLSLEINLEENKDTTLVIGDIHGNLDSLQHFIEMIEEEKYDHVIFLGDIVDRGAKQLECLITVLCLKILQPKKIILLKGNHETLEMNKAYGFFDEIESKFGSDRYYLKILDVYKHLPICVIINEKIACLHGGIPEDPSILKDLRELNGEDLMNSPDENLEKGIFQILWNDPKEGLKGFMGSYRGPGIKFFGEDAFDNFLEENELDYVIRAHEWFQGLGYKWFFDDRLLSIFSSENYRGEYFPTPAGYAVVKNNRIYPREFSTS